MEIRKILIDNQVIEYQLNYKNIKRCYLKISNGQLIVNSGLSFTINNIEEMIMKNKKVILDRLGNYVAKYDYQDGGYVYIFNKRYTIVLRNLKEKKIGLHEDKLYV